MTTTAEIKRQRADLREMLVSVIEDEGSASYYASGFCQFASKFFPGEGRYALYKLSVDSKEGVLIVFGRGNEEIKIVITNKRTLVAIPLIGGILEFEGRLIIPPKEYQNNESLVLVTDRRARAVVGIKHGIVSNRTSIRQPVISVEQL